MANRRRGAGPVAPQTARRDAQAAGASAAPRRPTVVALGIAVVALLFAGTLSAVALGGRNGSASPQAAVERLFSAIADEDVIGVVESLPPGERSALRPGLNELAVELSRLGLVSGDVDLRALQGVDVEVGGLRLAADQLGTGVAAVTIIEGIMSTSASPDRLPIGPVVRRLLESLGGAPLQPSTTTTDLAGDEAVLVAIEEDGGWHVSVFYTLAEMARKAAGEAVPDFGRGVDPQGADDPEAAVRRALEAAIDLDVRRLIALTSPDEMRVLHDYALLFLDEVEEAVTAARADGVVPGAISRLELESEVDGDEAVVRLAGLDAAGSLPDGSSFSVTYDGDCFSYEANGKAERTCAGPDLAATTVRRHGQWYVSPTRTVGAQMLAALRVIDADDLRADDLGGAESLLGPLVNFGFALSDGPSSRCTANYQEVPDDASLEELHRARDELLACFDQYGEG